MDRSYGEQNKTFVKPYRPGYSRRDERHSVIPDGRPDTRLPSQSPQSEAVDSSDDRYNNALNPSFSSNLGIPIRGAATTDFSKASLPKHFAQPLTCFYWYHMGGCSKPDDKCIYAHYYTGVVASAPVSVGGGKGGSIAGRNAMYEVQQQTEREKKLDDREAKICAEEAEVKSKLAALRDRVADLDDMEASIFGKEAEVDGKLAALREREILLEEKDAKVKAAETGMQNIYKDLADIKEAADAACVLLHRGREDVAALTVKVEDPQAEASALSAFDSAVDAAAGIGLNIEMLLSGAAGSVTKAAS